MQRPGILSFTWIEVYRVGRINLYTFVSKNSTKVVKISEPHRVLLIRFRGYYKSNVRERSCIIRPTVSGHLLRYKYVFDVLGIWWIWIWRWKYCIADLQFYLSECISFAWYHFCILKAVTTSGFFFLFRSYEAWERI